LAALGRLAKVVRFWVGPHLRSPTAHLASQQETAGDTQKSFLNYLTVTVPTQHGHKGQPFAVTVHKFDENKLRQWSGRGSILKDARTTKYRDHLNAEITRLSAVIDHRSPQKDGPDSCWRDWGILSIRCGRPDDKYLTV
jgi:hypothetical protein